MASVRTVLIVGASLAGAKAAETLRDEGFDGRIHLIGEEPHRPYERPPVSKGYLRGEVDFDGPAVHESSFYEQNGIELRTATRVGALDLEASEVELDSGERLGYDRLLLATGAEPRRLRVPGSDLEGVLYLRTVGDADAIRAAVTAGVPVVVIGAGWIGSEVTASARQLGAEVTMVDLAAVPLERVLGADVGAVFRDLHAAHGVNMRFGAGIESIRGTGRVEEVRLTDGTVLPAGAVVAGVGVVPRTTLASSAGIEVDDGILTDEYLATSAPGVYAAGDVAAVPYALYGTRIRLEHWSAALHQGPAAARSMLGGSDPYDRVPYFFSDQYDFGMEYWGWAPHFDEVVFRGDPAKGEFIAFWTSGGAVVAAMNANIWDVGEPLESLVRGRASVAPTRLADPALDLAQI